MPKSIQSLDQLLLLTSNPNPKLYPGCKFIKTWGFMNDIPRFLHNHKETSARRIAWDLANKEHTNPTQSIIRCKCYAPKGYACIAPAHLSKQSREQVAVRPGDRPGKPGRPAGSPSLAREDRTLTSDEYNTEVFKHLSKLKNTIAPFVESTYLKADPLKANPVDTSHVPRTKQAKDAWIKPKKVDKSRD